MASSASSKFSLCEDSMPHRVNTYCGLIPWQAQVKFFPPGILSSGQDNLLRAGEVAQLVEHLPA